MDYIWAPWRMQYVLDEKPEGCFLCDNPSKEKESEDLILYRGQQNFVIMNRYPYNPGHLLIAPYRHIGDLEELTESERNEHFELVCHGVKVLKKVMNPGGFNIGANLGSVAGAGLADHYHSHIVPRWLGDTNYIPVLADLRIVTQALKETYNILVKEFEYH